MKNTSRSWTYLDTALEKNILWSLAITVLPAASSFITSWIIARGLGPGVLGTVSWVMAFATACLIIAKFGIGIASSRLASEYGVSFPGSLRGLLRSGIELRLAFTIPTVLIVFSCASIIADTFGNPSLSSPIRIGSAVILCASIYEFKEHFLVGLNRLAVVYKIRAGYHLARVILTTIIVSAGWGAFYILSGYCAAWLMATAVYLVLLMRFLPESDAEIKPGAIRKRLFILSLPLAVSGASVALYSQMDKLMLGYFCEMADVGQYSIARNIVEVSLFPVFAVVMALRPALASRFAAGKLDDCVKIIQKAVFLSFLSGVFFTAVFVMFSKPLIVFVFSERFEEAGMLMLIFAWVIGMRSLGSIILPALIAAEKTKAYAYLTAFSAVINFILNIILIREFKAKGAVAATVVSYAFLLIIGLFLVIRTFNIELTWRKLFLLLKVITAGALSTFILRFTIPHAVPRASVLLWIGVQAFVYAALLLAFRAVNLKDLKSLKTFND